MRMQMQTLVLGRYGLSMRDIGRSEACYASTRKNVSRKSSRDKLMPSGSHRLG